MLCQECGRDLIALGVHVRYAHQMSRAEYCLRHNLPKMTALIDPDVRQHLSEKARMRLLTAEGAEHVRRLCASRDSGPHNGPGELPACTRAAHRARNRRYAASQLRVKRDEILPDLRPLWAAGVPTRDLCLRFRVAACTLRTWQREGVLPTRRLRYALVQPT